MTWIVSRDLVLNSSCCDSLLEVCDMLLVWCLFNDNLFQKREFAINRINTETVGWPFYSWPHRTVSHGLILCLIHNKTNEHKWEKQQKNTWVWIFPPASSYVWLYHCHNVCRMWCLCQLVCLRVRGRTQLLSVLHGCMSSFSPLYYGVVYPTTSSR